MLAPFLFLLFINDISHHVDVKICLFADDCVLYQQITSPADQARLNTVLNNIVQWCNCWQKAINSEKTVLMSVTKKKSKLKYSYAAATSFLKP